MRYKYNGKEREIKGKVKPIGNGAMILVPLFWLGKKVKVVLL